MIIFYYLLYALTFILAVMFLVNGVYEAIAQFLEWWNGRELE